MSLEKKIHDEGMKAGGEPDQREAGENPEQEDDFAEPPEPVEKGAARTAENAEDLYVGEEAGRGQGEGESPVVQDSAQPAAEEADEKPKDPAEETEVDAAEPAAAEGDAPDAADGHKAKKKKDKKDKKHKKKHKKKDKKVKKALKEEEQRRFYGRDKSTHNIFGERRNSEESTKEFGISESRSMKSDGSIMSNTSVAVTDYAKDLAENLNRKEGRIFKKDANELYRKMMATIDVEGLPDDEEGPPPTLMDQVRSGGILRKVYHRQEVQLEKAKKLCDQKFHDRWKENFERLEKREKKREEQELKEFEEQLMLIQNGEGTGGGDEALDENGDATSQVSMTPSLLTKVPPSIRFMSQVPPSIQSKISGITGYSKISGVSQLSKRPSEMNDVEIQETTLSLRESLAQRSEGFSNALTTLRKYEKKDEDREALLRKGPGKGESCKLPFAENYDHKRRLRNMRKQATDEEDFNRRVGARIKQLRQEKKLQRNQEVIKMLADKKDKTTLEVLGEKKESKRNEKISRKRNAQVSDNIEQGCKNRDIGDRRFGENFKTDYRHRLYMNEKKKASEMCQEQFKGSDDEGEDQADVERDMGEGMGMDL